VSGKRFDILVVDDEANIRLGAERILQREGFNVRSAESGEEGLEILEQLPAHILLLDLMMPGIGGMEVLKRVAVSHPGLLVIVITGHATLETAIEAMKEGAYDFIPKPFKPDQLRIVVFRASETLRLREEHRRLEEERQRNLRAIEREKTRTRTIVRSMSEGVLLTDSYGDVILCNPAAQSMFGSRQDSCEGVPMTQYVSESGLRAQLEEILAEGDPPRPREIALPDGRWVLAEVSPIATEEEEGGLLTVLSDITAQKNLAQLKSEFVAKVSHDLRSPLAAINQQLAVLAMDLEGAEHEEHRRRLSRVRERVKGLLSLIADLLDISRIELGVETGTHEVFDPRIVLERAVEEVASHAEEAGISLSVQPCPRSVEMMGDPRDLESVFTNLLTNAVKYTDRGGSVTVTVDASDTQLAVTVADTGHGIAESELPHIFEKFYRVKSEKTRMIVGTGLGLPIVKGIVTAMGGAIDVRSELGAGSSFIVSLPLHRTA
jgi:PAS domain S-box-containing protein